MDANVVLRIWDQNRSGRLGNLMKVKHSTEYEITVKWIHKTVILRPRTPTKSFEPSAVYCWIGKLSLVTKWQFVNGALHKIFYCSAIDNECNKSLQYICPIGGFDSPLYF